MVDALRQEILDYSARQLEQHVKRIETWLGKLTEEQVWARGSDNENAVGNLVLHLSGNVRQWIVAGVGGATDTRDRDSEFAARGGVPIPDLLARLRGTVAEGVAVIKSVSTERLLERVTVQKYNVTVMEAILHVVDHFGGHTGQIMFATKMMTSSDLGFYRHLSMKAAHSEKTP